MELGFVLSVSPVSSLWISRHRLSRQLWETSPCDRCLPHQAYVMQAIKLSELTHALLYTVNDAQSLSYVKYLPVTVCFVILV